MKKTRSIAMKRMSRIVTLAGFLLMMVPAAFSQVDEIEDKPGYVDFEWIPIPPDAERVTDAVIGPRLLLMVREAETRRVEARKAAAESSTVELKRKMESAGPPGNLEEKLVSLQIKAFRADPAELEKIRPLITRFERNLNRKDWKPVIRVKQPRQLTNISVKYGDGRKVEGILIMSLDPDSEASFVNIIGDVKLDALRNMLVDVDENALDSLRKCLETNRKTVIIRERLPKK
jgi:hypothetical protein